MASDVRVPFDLLFHPDLTPSAKLIWMLQAAQRTITTRRIDPAADSDLFRHTVRLASRQLVAAGWSAPGGPAGSTAAALPVHLLLDRRVSAQARVLYGILQGVPKFCAIDQSGRFTYTALRKQSGTGINTLKRAIAELTRTEWLLIAQKRARAPIEFVLGNPVATMVEAWVKKARWRIKRARNKGEAIMHEYLSLLIDSEDYQDNVKLGILVNPSTGERMEFDRYYPKGVAFEFQGPQHFGNTDQFSKQEVADQMARDHMKRGICAKEGITLLEVRREDLSLNTMKRRVGTHLPLRDLTGLERLIEVLETVALSHRRSEGRVPSA